MLNTTLPQEITLPNYDESIVNLSCSILKYYGVQTKHGTLPAADRLLAKNNKHVVVILLDGLGMNILEQTLSTRDFLRRNLVTDYSSTFPSTTVASTTSFLSGQTPIEHGWLGWNVYFEQEDKTVTCFKNTLQGTETPAADYHVARKYLPYKNIIELINESGNAKANAIFPFGKEKPMSLDEWIEEIKKSCHQKEKTFTYAYWENPDVSLYVKGTNSNDIKPLVEELNQKITYLCQDCPETAFIITADHGHIEITNELLTQTHKDLAQMLIRQPSIEPRAISFYVKPEYLKEFPRVFNDYYGKDYVLLSRNEILDNQYFGTGFTNNNITGIGDFVGIAYNHKTIVWDEKCNLFKSHHAGMTKEEMRIPLICYEYQKDNSSLYIYYGIIGMIIITLLTILF